MAKHANITKPDDHGYQVRIVRQGTEYSRYFSKKVWGSDTKALNAAINWRDMKRASLPKKTPYINDQPKNNSTGVNGISKVIHHDKRRDTKTLRYQVSYRTIDGRQSVRTFQVGRIEDVSADQDLHAFRTALLFRKEYELARSIGETFDNNRFGQWKMERLY
ncbi:MAG: hypothetical protein KUG82_08300 [Pseudomonadales bacterium]|nr:hypothetical protein [Pseudomonadales bacterium]